MTNIVSITTFEPILYHYRIIRTALLHYRRNATLAGHEFQLVERFAERLRGITNLVQVLASHANAFKKVARNYHVLLDDDTDREVEVGTYSSFFSEYKNVH
ncbi:MAG: hypothetical protein GWP06_03830 [Actinobacteria bacterium]|nr:hypothetical protein [Actinomycetota bacterium]